MESYTSNVLAAAGFPKILTGLILLSNGYFCPSEEKKNYTFLCFEALRWHLSKESTVFYRNLIRISKAI